MSMDYSGYGSEDNVLAVGVLIGWTCIIMCTFQFIYIVVLITDVPRAINRMSTEDRTEDNITVDALKTMIYILLSTYLSFVTLDLISSVLLLYGIKTKLYLLILPWLILNAFSILVKFFCCVCLIIFCFLSGMVSFKTVLVILFHFVTTGLFCWIWIIVLSLYEHVKHG